MAQGLHVSLVSSRVASAADQIALWPDDDHPKLPVRVRRRDDRTPPCSASTCPSPPARNATTIVTGLSSCDPVRRTPWGTIIVAEEAGATGGLYEIIDPVNITTPINVTNRDAGTTTRSRCTS